MPAPDLTQEELHAWLQAFTHNEHLSLDPDAPLLSRSLTQTLRDLGILLPGGGQARPLPIPAPLLP